jgi:hypothetical protein
MSEAHRRQKITFGEMRASGVRGVLIYFSDYRCSHSTAISADQCPAVRPRSEEIPSGHCEAKSLEAPAPIGQEAQPAADRGAGETAEVVRGF